MAAAKTEFVNKTQGYLGVVKIDRKGEPVGQPVPPEERVFLTAEEVELTEQAHARAEDSPFFIREIVHFNVATQEETDRFTAAPLERVPPKRGRPRKVAAAA